MRIVTYNTCFLAIEWLYNTISLHTNKRILMDKISRRLSNIISADRIKTRLIDRIAYANDASYFRLVPQAVAQPKRRRPREGVSWAGMPGQIGVRHVRATPPRPTGCLLVVLPGCRALAVLSFGIGTQIQRRATHGIPELWRKHRFPAEELFRTGK